MTGEKSAVEDTASKFDDGPCTMGLCSEGAFGDVVPLISEADVITTANFTLTLQSYTPGVLRLNLAYTINGEFVDMRAELKSRLGQALDCYDVRVVSGSRLYTCNVTVDPYAMETITATTINLQRVTESLTTQVTFPGSGAHNLSATTSCCSLCLLCQSLPFNTVLNTVEQQCPDHCCYGCCAQ